MTAVRTSELLATWVASEIEAQALGEDFGYETSWRLARTPQGAPVMSYDVVVTLRHPLLGQHPLTAHAPVPAQAVIEATVREVVAGMMALLRTQHRDLLAGLKKGTAQSFTGPAPSLS